MLFTKYLLFLFFFDKNQFLFELENIYKKIFFYKKNSNLFRKTLQFIFKKSYPRFILKKYFKLIKKLRETKVQIY